MQGLIVAQMRCLGLREGVGLPRRGYSPSAALLPPSAVGDQQYMARETLELILPPEDL